MDVKRVKISFLCGVMLISLVLLLTGCQKKQEGVQVFEYKFSIGNKEQTDTQTSYLGLVGVPKEDDCPVVFIFHGAHALVGESFPEYYKGFEYLVKELAAHGYLAISIDINNAYTGDSREGDEYTRIKNAFKVSYDHIVLANHGKNLFPVDLKGKADLEKVNLIGHSRGGDSITQMIAHQDFRKISFVSAIKIAAAGNHSLREIYADIPTALIYSQYDEDINDCASADYYYHAYESDIARKFPIVSAYVYGANHGAYNTLVESTGLVNYENVSMLDADIQRSFTKKFTLDFLDVNNKDQNLFDVFNNNTSKQYGIDFMLSIHDPLGNRILAPDEYMQNITAQDMDLEYVVSSKNPLKNTAKAFNPPGNPEKLPLYKLSWEKVGGRIIIPIDGMYYGVGEGKLLSLYMALDSSDTKNIPYSPVTFDVIITDSEGKRVVIPYSSKISSALKYQLGKLVEEEPGASRWSYLTPLGTELISIEDLSNKIIVDNIVLLEIVPTCTTGAIMIGGIDVYEKGLDI